MKGSFLTLGAMKDPFIPQTVTKDPFITRHSPAEGTETRGAKAHNPTGLPAIPSTWQRPITPGQGAPKPHATTNTKPPGPLDAV